MEGNKKKWVCIVYYDGHAHPKFHLAIILCVLHIEPVFFFDQSTTGIIRVRMAITARKTWLLEGSKKICVYIVMGTHSQSSTSPSYYESAHIEPVFSFLWSLMVFSIIGSFCKALAWLGSVSLDENVNLRVDQSVGDTFQVHPNHTPSLKREGCLSYWFCEIVMICWKDFEHQGNRNSSKK